MKCFHNKSFKVINPYDMKDIPSNLRDNINEQYKFGSMEIAIQQTSKDGTQKIAYRLLDGQIIESVLMPYRDGRYTACISSQAGCAMKCVFCATGQMGFARQLSANEIFEQVLLFQLKLQREGKRLSNVVFMGMGEPLNNYDNVMTAISRMKSDIGIGSRHITVSTVGVVPKIKRLADEGLQINLAVSLHQSNNAARSALMPVNLKYPIEELIEACKYYIEKTNRRISFEWALINGVTDTDAAARELATLLKGWNTYLYAYECIYVCIYRHVVSR
jgi:23S rRNA (adenine2503-C2)-methyltransferase